MNPQGLSGWHAVEAGQQPLSWELWASDVNHSTALTPAGRDAVSHAIDVIDNFLGKDWLDRFLPGKPHPTRDDGLPLMDLNWWPANDVDHVHSRLLTFAARLELLRPCPGFAQVRRDMRADLGHFAHGVLQFETGALALRRVERQRVMAQHPHVAGLVLSAPPGISPPRPTLEAGLITTGATLLDSTAGTTLRRHTLFVPRDRHDAPALTHWLDWYRTESDWLTWALERLGWPPSTDLFASNA